MITKSKQRRAWSLGAIALLTCCGGIAVVDPPDDGLGPGEAAPGGATQQDAGATDATDAGPGDAEAGPPVYCNRLKGPLEEYDGHEQTDLCEPWQICAYIQGSGVWSCQHPDDV